MPERARLHRLAGDHDAVILNAHYRRQRFARHSHDTYAIGLVSAGALVFERDRQRWVAPAGTICLINPGDIHTGEALADGWTYWNAYLPVGLMRRMLAGLTTEEIVFPSAVLDDEDLRDALRLFFELAIEKPEPIACQEALVDALVHLLRHRGPCPPHGLSDPEIVRRAKEYLAAHFAEPVSLEGAAALLGVTGAHLTRVFRTNTGLPLHAWLVQYRVGKASSCLRKGIGIADTAIACGFSDQAHLTRWLKRLTGLTPAQFRPTSRTFKTH